MPELEIAVPRPQRWDEPFGEMTERTSISCCGSSRFAASTRARFRRRCRCAGFCWATRGSCGIEPGDVIVREGDYGNSAFLVLSGTVRVVLERLDPKLLGREEQPRRGWLQAIAQLWQNSRLPEVRQTVGPHGEANGTSIREEDGATRVFLQDVPRLLAHTGTVQLGAGEIFGELAALSRTPRTATVLADGPATLLEIRWQGLRDLMRRTPAIREHVERLYRENSLRVHLRETPLLKELPAEAVGCGRGGDRVRVVRQFRLVHRLRAASAARRGRADCGRAAHRGRRRSADGAAT